MVSSPYDCIINWVRHGISFWGKLDELFICFGQTLSIIFDGGHGDEDTS